MTRLQIVSFLSLVSSRNSACSNTYFSIEIIDRKDPIIEKE